RLALCLTAGMLPETDSRVRPKPPAAYGTGSLPGLWHGDDYRHHSPAAAAEFLVHARWVSFAEHGWVTSRERRSDDAVVETNQAWAADIRRRRHVADFTGWRDHDSYVKGLNRLLRDLKSGAPNA
ncbi:MAG: hypothetical protein WBW33_18300, partial [Bryobacteraceae bacterium]